MELFLPKKKKKKKKSHKNQGKNVEWQNHPDGGAGMPGGCSTLAIAADILCRCRFLAVAVAVLYRCRFLAVATAVTETAHH